MCGIFGIVYRNKSKHRLDNFVATVERLVRQSQERGRDSLGLYIRSGEKAWLHKHVGEPEEFVKRPSFQKLLKLAFEEAGDDIFLLGLSRLTTNGSAIDYTTIQPIEVGEVIGVHNGIFTHIESQRIDTQLNLGTKSDSQIFFEILESKIKNKDDPEATLTDLLSNSSGSYSMAIFFQKSNQLVLASNTGSLYYHSAGNEQVIFASEKAFVEEIVSGDATVVKEKIAVFELKSQGLDKFELIRTPEKRNLKRCSQCILPHTYPFISFDKNGVCNFCLAYEKQKVQGEEELLKQLDKYRSKDGSPDCLVGLSGGRDSSYGLWALKKKFGMNPIAYTFDWGLTTDSSRRNQAIVTGKLGIEHIIRTPDIGQRRRHIQKNIDAFLKSPHLGMVPLFMAGDKDFYHYGRKLRDDLKIPLSIHCTGHEVERLHFKTGFCGVDDQDQHNVRMYDFSNFNKLKLALFYTGQYLKNPSYINESFFYSLRSFVYSFLQKDDFLYLYRYIQWDEAKIEKTLAEELGWEPDPKYGKNQWRMGDGQTAFTNYIYFTVAGFSEFDNFRANQVRAGLLDRNEALRLAAQDNVPKWEVLKDFSMTVGFCLEDVVKKINQIPKI